MCLFTNNKKAKTAKEDITVWKLFLTTSDGELLSIIQQHKYAKGLQPEVGFSYGFKNRVYKTVERGYHAFTSLESAMNSSYIYDEIRECIVPNGAKYYTSDRVYSPTKSEIVANQIIIGHAVKI